jgi:hypothetical protein
MKNIIQSFDYILIQFYISNKNYAGREILFNMLPPSKLLKISLRLQDN